MPDLTIRTRETFTSGISGEALAFDKTQTITGVNRIQKMLFQPPTTGQTEIIRFAALEDGAGTFKVADFKYLRITNFDSTNAIEIYFSDSSTNHYFAIQLNAGCSYIMTSLDYDVRDNGLASGVSAAELDLIEINSLVAACDVEVIVAQA